MGVTIKQRLNLLGFSFETYSIESRVKSIIEQSETKEPVMFVCTACVKGVLCVDTPTSWTGFVL